MITKDNFKNVLEELGFNGINDNYFSKTYLEGTSGEFKLVAEFNNGKFLFSYPDGVKMDRSTTVDDHQKESYVVFECVARLFDVGYKPENITLEGLNHEGHDQGWIDILVKDNEGTEYLIIECKTSGEKDYKDDEFEKHWRRTLNDGDQLFRYFNTYSKAQHLCLYTADYVDEKLVNKYHAITLKDNEEYLKQNKKFKSYKTLRENQGSKEEFFEVWKDTYLLDYSTNGIFEPDCKPFDIGQKKFAISDLKEIDSSSMQKKYNEFATILRKYNVSSKENAFDKLINLFLAKIVDETNNQSELKCLWKGAAYDNYFDMQDRLLGLYKIGMEKFFKEDVAYVENNEIENAFKFLKNASEEDVAKKTILEYFRILKYFNNNPFAFLDVHNEELFYQNAVILKEIVNMVQDIKIKTEEQNQFLGDLFEGFLDQGIKQSEGQFFTPLPIVKFLISSLPLDNLIKESKDLPKVIDYACGAGHFLTEYANQIKPIVKKYNKSKLEDYYKNIHGIEKEYRLSKVSQVSAFMYGQDGIKILYKDALAECEEVKEGTYSVLIANPPYSVKGFLETLSDEDREKFELFNADINIDTNNSIETFFVERAKQLLKKDGIAAIILPSSVLSNGNIYIKCREIILKHFDVVAIFESGSGTFGKTGTNTATLFMRRREDTPSLAEQYANRVNSWFSGNFDYDRVYEDSDLMEKYCYHQNYPLEEYKKFLARILTDELLKNDIFADYKRTLDIYSVNGRIDTKGLNKIAKDIRTKARSRVKTKTYKNLSESEKEKFETDTLISFCSAIEKDKLYYFMLSISNDDVLVIKSPTNTTEIKKFLGYEWSDSKGNEGIKYLNVKVDKAEDGEETDDTMQQVKGIEGIQTPLFNPKDFDDSTKLNYYIKQNFLAKSHSELVSESLPDSLRKFASFVPLVDMLDFGRTIFDKAIKTQLKIDNGEMKIESKYPLVKLGEVANIKGGDTFKEIYQGNKNSSDIPFFKVGDMNSPENTVFMNISNNYVNETILRNTIKATIFGERTMIFPKVGMAIHTNKKRLLGRKSAIDNNTMAVWTKNEGKLLQNYLFDYFLSNVELKSIASSSNPPSINSTNLGELKIPLPPMNIQKNIVSECEQIGNEYSDAQKKIEECKNEISAIMGNVKGDEKKLKDICNMKAGKFVSANEIYDEQLESMYPCYGGNGLRGYTKDFTHDGTYPLVGRQGALCGNVCLATGKFHATEHAVAVTPKENIDVLWLRYELEYMNLNQYATGSAQPGLSVNKILEVKCFVPSLSDQKKIVEQITALEEQINAAKKTMAACPQKKAEVLKKWL